MLNPMISRYFGHGLIRKYVIAFGTLFDNISVVNFDSSGVEVNRQIVPLRYGPREKFIVRNEQDPTLERTYAMKYPRMAFEMTNFRYDPERKQPNLAYTRTAQPGNYATQLANNFSYSPAPYVISFSLHITSKSADEASQIVEQILPFFTPEFNVNINSVVEQGTESSLPITLTSVTPVDTYSGDFRDRRVIEWTLTFDMKVNFHGPVRSSVIAKEATVGIDDNPVTVDTTGLNLRTAPHHTELNSNLLIKLKREALNDYGFSEYE